MLRNLLLLVAISVHTAAFAAEIGDINLAVEAMRRQPDCAAGSHCDAVTGCLIPAPELAEPEQTAASGHLPPR